MKLFMNNPVVLWSSIILMTGIGPSCGRNVDFSHLNSNDDLLGCWVESGAGKSNAIEGAEKSKIWFDANGDFRCQNFSAVASYYPELKVEVVSQHGKWFFNSDRSVIHVTFFDGRRGVNFDVVSNRQGFRLLQLTDLDYPEGYFFDKSIESKGSER